MLECIKNLFNKKSKIDNNEKFNEDNLPADKYYFNQHGIEIKSNKIWVNPITSKNNAYRDYEELRLRR